MKDFHLDGHQCYLKMTWILNYQYSNTRFSICIQIMNNLNILPSVYVSIHKRNSSWSWQPLDSNTGPCGSVVEHPLRDREVVGSNPGRAIPKALKMVPVATLLDAQHYKASTGFSSPNKHRTTIIATLTKSPKKKLSSIIINVCIHRRNVWKTGNYAKYVILLKYR